MHKITRAQEEIETTGPTCKVSVCHGLKISPQNPFLVISAGTSQYDITMFFERCFCKYSNVILQMCVFLHFCVVSLSGTGSTDNCLN